MSKIVALTLVTFGGMIIGWFAREELASSTAPATPRTMPSILMAAPGRIEGLSETINLGSAATGTIQDIFVKVGDVVKKGQLLARMECNDLAAELPQRVAEYEAASAVSKRLEHGNRSEDIVIAEADLELSRARLVEAKATNDRLSSLVPKGGATIAQATTAQRDLDMAEALLKISDSRLSRTRTGARIEEIEEAQAKSEAARHLVQLTKAKFARCEIRSSADATVLRKTISVGELVTVYSPSSLFQLASLDHFRVRAEVDEYDVGKLSLGQRADIVTEPPSGHKIGGRVVELGRSMGRRRILTNDLADKSDRDVLEVLLEIEDQEVSLPIGLRVAVIFQKNDDPPEPQPPLDRTSASNLGKLPGSLNLRPSN